MVSMGSLWLSIVLTGVLVFVASSIIHMVLNWHASDWSKLPGESALLEALRKAGLEPGDYVFPHATSMKELAAPEMAEKFERGPVGLLTVKPSGAPRMGKQLTIWFVYSLVVGVVVAYLTGRTLGPDSEYLQVFRVAGTTAFLCFAGAEPIMSIWYGRSWTITFKNMVDGLIYALVTAGAFAGFWPT